MRKEKPTKTLKSNLGNFKLINAANIIQYFTPRKSMPKHSNYVNKTIKQTITKYHQ